MRERQKEVRLYRGQIPSPVAPSIAWREDRVVLGSDCSRERARGRCVEAGVSSPGRHPVVPQRWWGEPPSCDLSGRYLSFSEREDIAIWRPKESGFERSPDAWVASPSTISRELRRNASTRYLG